MKYDFSGWATKNNIKCSDGRTIRKDAFKHNDGQTVPLVWQHLHNEPGNVLGHAVLENREDGVYTYGKFNNTDAGKQARELVKHGDLTSLSIYANQLKQEGDSVLHGIIREVSLVVAGANPGAKIDNLTFAHSDGTYVTEETEAIVTSGEEGLTLAQEDTEATEDTEDTEDVKHSESAKTLADIFNEFTSEQKDVVYALLASTLGDEVEHSDDEGGNTSMKKNVFDREDQNGSATLSHAEFQTIMETAVKNKASFKDTFLAHVGAAGVDYGITDIDFLFPEARNITQTPTFISREMSWVPGVLSGVHKTPFSRIKSVHADITADEARALGYVKGNLKKEEVIKLLKRVTTPQTVYKKQKLDRDDIVDITDMDVVAWLKMEMRMMLDEELARAFLVGDGRDPESVDKIKTENIRPIFSDDDMYAHKVPLANDIATKDIIDEFIRAREHYKGSGNPTLYTSTKVLMDMLLLKDTLGRRLYNTKSELASALLVNDIVEVPVLAGVTRIDDTDPLNEKTMDLVGIIVNLKDYNVGADKGGQISLFDDFDIDYNQYKYLMETRVSAALVKPKSALVFEKLPALVG